MRNLANQKRVFNAYIFTLAMWLLFAILFIAIFFNALFPSATYFGISNFAYTQEAPADKIQNGDLVFYKKGTPKEGKLFAYTTNIRNEKGIAKKTLQIKILIRIEHVEEIIETDEEEITKVINYYVVKSPGQDAESYIKLDDKAILGSYLFSIPKVGYALMYLNYNLFISILIVAVLALLLLCLPVLLIVKRVRLNRLPSPFYEGIDLTKLSKENYYIYSELRHFFIKAKMIFEKGNDCVKVFAPAGENRKILFATIVHTNKTIRVLINRDFKRDDDRLDRSAFITIFNAIELPEVKSRINSIYKEFFKPVIQKYNSNNYQF